MYQRIEKNIVNIVISLNRACNLRCFHCCLSNEYKKNNKIISEKMLNDYFILIEDWLIKNKHNLSHLTILISGAEIGMIEDNIFTIYAEKIYNFFNYISRKYSSEHLAISMFVLSNLTHFSEIKKQWVLKKSILAKQENLLFNLGTSFEKYTNRFHSEIIYKRWKNNIKFFLDNDVSTTIIWSVSKKDAEDYLSILNEFEQIGSNVIYVPVIPTGETINNPEMFLDYENFSNFLVNLYSYKFTKPLFVNQLYIGHYDRTCNFILEQNGYIMIDLLQDQVIYHENNNTFEFNHEYLEKNKHIIKLENDIEKNKVLFNSLWNNYLKSENEKMKKQGCFTCEYFNSCKGGIGTFKPIYHTKDKCSGFKKTLDKYFKH